MLSGIAGDLALSDHLMIMIVKSHGNKRTGTSSLLKVITLHSTITSKLE